MLWLCHPCGAIPIYGTLHLVQTSSLADLTFSQPRSVMATGGIPTVIDAQDLVSRDADLLHALVPDEARRAPLRQTHWQAGLHQVPAPGFQGLGLIDIFQAVSRFRIV